MHNQGKQLNTTIAIAPLSTNLSRTFHSQTHKRQTSLIVYPCMLLLTFCFGNQTLIFCLGSMLATAGGERSWAWGTRRTPAPAPPPDPACSARTCRSPSRPCRTRRRHCRCRSASGIATAAAILHSGHHHHQSFPLRHLQHNNNLRDFEQK